MSKIKNTKVLTTAGMLSAIAIILGLFKVPINSFVELRFAFLPIAVSGTLFGPFVGSIVGIISDIGGHIVKPTGPFFPGFTISAAVSGIIFGIGFYKKEITVTRVLIVQIIRIIVIGFILNNLWLSILFNKGFVAIFLSRIFKELVMIPIGAFMLLLVLKPVRKFGIIEKHRMV